jgi:hypothetical protein
MLHTLTSYPFLDPPPSPGATHLRLDVLVRPKPQTEDGHRALSLPIGCCIHHPPPQTLLRHLRSTHRTWVLPGLSPATPHRHLPIAQLHLPAAPPSNSKTPPPVMPGTQDRSGNLTPGPETWTPHPTTPIHNPPHHRRIQSPCYLHLCLQSCHC